MREVRVGRQRHEMGGGKGVMIPHMTSKPQQISPGHTGEKSRQ